MGGSEWGGESAPRWLLSQTALLNAGGFHGNEGARQEPWPLFSSLCLGSGPHCLHPAKPQVSLCRCWGSGRGAWRGGLGGAAQPGWRLGGLAPVLGRRLAPGLPAKRPTPSPPWGPHLGLWWDRRALAAPGALSEHKGPFRSPPLPARRKAVQSPRPAVGWPWARARPASAELRPLSSPGPETQRQAHVERHEVQAWPSRTPARPSAGAASGTLQTSGERLGLHSLAGGLSVVLCKRDAMTVPRRQGYRWLRGWCHGARWAASC